MHTKLDMVVRSVCNCLRSFFEILFFSLPPFPFTSKFLREPWSFIFSALGGSLLLPPCFTWPVAMWLRVQQWHAVSLHQYCFSCCPFLFVTVLVSGSSPLGGKYFQLLTFSSPFFWNLVLLFLGFDAGGFLSCWKVGYVSGLGGGSDSFRSMVYSLLVQISLYLITASTRMQMQSQLLLRHSLSMLQISPQKVRQGMAR
jgi:hypothetical protein